MGVRSVESRRFSEVLRAAMEGENDAVEAILSRYMPLISKESVIDGAVDEDARKYILMRIIKQLASFDFYSE